jgi:hypothetical protein
MPVPGLPPPLLPHNLSSPITRDISELPDDEDRKDEASGKKKRGRGKNKNKKDLTPSRQTLQKLYDLSNYEIIKLRKMFDQHSGVDRKLNFQEFIRLYGHMNPNLRGPAIIVVAERAFQASDSNDDGLINFDEFLIAYCLTKPYNSISRFSPGLNRPRVMPVHPRMGSLHPAMLPPMRPRVASPVRTLLVPPPPSSCYQYDTNFCQDLSLCCDEVPFCETIQPIF